LGRPAKSDIVEYLTGWRLVTHFNWFKANKVKMLGTDR